MPRRPPATSICSICGKRFSRLNHSGPADECLECQKIPAYPQYPIQVLEVDGKILVKPLYREPRKPKTCYLCTKPATHGHYCEHHHGYRLELLKKCSEEGALFGV